MTRFAESSLTFLNSRFGALILVTESANRLESLCRVQPSFLQFFTLEK